ncbi:MAG TPA: ribonuclease R [Candidatus Paceibacterota bacterium]|nr:ribonuclease R [Candidatus Paceibacterota bacterium]HMP18801.1 ribonuclease R [Candidatus Paceibacterota bacterium]HMP85296.1 ribonuclease R [Candidatus Paceibacterota bacterium]
MIKKDNNTNSKKIIEGKITTTGKGLGFIANFDDKDDVLIEKNDLKTALNGDNVRVQILPEEKDGRTLGKVIAVLGRFREQFVGTVFKTENICFVKPDSHKIYTNFLLSDSDILKVKNNDKVLVKFIKWDETDSGPTVSVIKIIGEKGNHETEIQSIIFEKGFDAKFKIEIENEAKILKEKWSPIPQTEIEKRKDLRNEDVMTIDPVDAKDFDDALHIKKLPNGNFEIGIHIADVSHFVTPNTALDEEAYQRGSSVYLVDRTIPMLPEILSNDLCSLNPKEDKLAFSSIFEMNQNAEIISRWFGKTIINSKKRFTYEEAQAILDAGSGIFYEELNQLNILAKILNKRNKEAGAIEFEKEEIKFELDQNGRPIKIIKKEPLETHKLVENMMLLSNREVAKFIHDKGKKFGGDQNVLIYRVHSTPDKDKVNDLVSFVKLLGYNLKLEKDGELRARNLNDLFEKIQGRDEEQLIKSVAIKTMSKAVYANENSGHFGLAFEYYTHFTSPIRRYPDLLVHRVLAKFLDDKKLEKSEIIRLEKGAILSTEREISAAEAERESIKYKQAEYMQDHIGEEFEGIVSGVSPWGLYVQIKETLSEGMVHISKLGNDYFKLDEEKYQIVGEKTGQIFRLSDKLIVKIESIDLERNNINMAVIKILK